MRSRASKHGAYNHEAVFEVPTRGLTLRAFVPAKTAGQCWHAGGIGAVPLMRSFALAAIGLALAGAWPQLRARPTR